MAKDFRTDRIRTRAIIGTGSVATGKKNLNLMIYSGSKAGDHDGGTTGITLTNVGDDVWMYVDGTPSTSTNPHLRAHGGSVLFRGDVVVSGTLWSERSVVEVDDSTVGNFQAPKKIIGGHGGTAPDDLQAGFARILVDPTTKNLGSGRDGTISFDVVQGSSGDYSYATQFPSKHKDVFFHVGGAVGSKDSNDRGLALFDGDLHTSGNLSIDGSLTLGSALTVPGDLEIGGDLKLGGNDIKNSDNEICITLDADQNVAFAKGIRVNNDALTGSDGTVFLVHSGSGNVGIMGHLQITGNKIRTADGGDAITMDDSSNVTIAGDIQIGGNDIKNSDSEITITLDADQRVGIGGIAPSYKLDVDGDIRLRGNDIRDNSGNVAIGFDGSANTAVQGVLTLEGNELKDGGGARVLFLSGSGNATFDKNLTVVGDLNVSGSVTTIGTENLRVKDAMVLLASGAAGPNVRGGIAIASGSTLANRSLTFGAGIAATNRWRLGHKDVQDGAVSDVSDAEAVGLELAAIHFKDTIDDTFSLTFITASHDGGSTKLDIQNQDGGIFLTPNNHVYIPQSNKLYLDGSTATRYLEADSGGDLNIVGGTGKTEFTFGTMATFINAAGNQSRIEFLKDSNTLVLATPKTADPGGHNREITMYKGGHNMVVGSDGGLPGDAGEARTSLLVLSASSDEAIGGPMIILSASTTIAAGTNLREGVIVVGANAADANMFSMTEHRDVRTLLSGAISSIGTNTRGTTLATGDLVVSGNTKLLGTLEPAGGLDLPTITMTSTNANEPFIRFRDANHFIRRQTSGHLEFDDSQAPGGPYTLTQLASLAVTDNSDVFAVTHQNGAAPYLAYVASTGSFSFDHSATTNGYVPRRTNQIGSNVFFFVSGAVDSSVHTLETSRGAAVFGGDTIVSGALLVQAPASSIQVPLQVGTVGASASTALAVTGSMVLVDPVPGNDVRLSVEGSSSGLSFRVATGESFKIGSDENITVNGNNRIQLKNSSNRVYGVLDSGVEKLLIENQNTAGVIKINANNGAGHLAVTGSILPGTDSTFNLGSPDMRWANLYTGDLHLRNERGNWTIYEEPDMLVVVNNLTGKKYKMGLTPLEDEE